MRLFSLQGHAKESDASEMKLSAFALVLALAGCAGSKPHPAVVAIAEAWKFAKEVALAACVVIERPETMLLATVTLPDYGPVAVSVARLACALITSRPDAVAVVVSADGSGSAITMPQTSSGSE